MMKDCLLEVHPSWINQFSVATSEPVILPKMYKDFEGVFSVENVDHISSHKDYDYVINP